MEPCTPKRTNEQRAKLAEKVLNFYVTDQTIDPEDWNLGTYIQDLITDLLHFKDTLTSPDETQDMFRKALNNHDDEVWG